jgi:hypothetical protein
MMTTVTVTMTSMTASAETTFTMSTHSFMLVHSSRMECSMYVLILYMFMLGFQISWEWLVEI